MSFKSMIHDDIGGVFLNFSEFAERRDIRFNGNEYDKVPIVLQNTRERDRREHRTSFQDDPSQGFYLTRVVAFVALDSFNGVQPEQGIHMELKMDGRHGQPWWKRYAVRESQETDGLLKIQLEAVDE